MNERPTDRPRAGELSTVVLLEASPERYSLAVSAVAGVAAVVRDIEAVSRGKGGIVLVDLGRDLERALHTIEETRSALPQVQIVALADEKDPDVILRAMRAGAVEFALLGEGLELAYVLRKLLKRIAAEESSGKPGGKIVAVFPAKGGVGATTLATNLAASLCTDDKRVLVVDFDRHLGGVLVFLDMAARYSLADVSKNMARLDRELLLSSLGQHPCGMYVLAQSESLESADTVSPSQVGPLLRLASRHFDYVVCDGLRGFDETTLAVLDAADTIEHVLVQDVVALKNGKRCLEIFERLGYGERKVDLVVNRYLKKAKIDLWAIAENLGAEVRATLVNDHPAATAALNRGVPLREAAPASGLTEDIAQLAARIAGAPARERRGFLGRLFGRSEEPRQLERKGTNVDVARRTPQTN